MNKQLLTLSALGCAIFLSGCAGKTGHKFLEEKSPQEIQGCLIKGKTTKEEVRSTFGEPCDIDFDINHNETWKYEFKRSEAKGINYVPFANLFMSGTDDIVFF